MRVGNNEFTKIVQSKGWTVTRACELWGIRYATFYARVNNPKKHQELRSMCLGLQNLIEDIK